MTGQHHTGKLWETLSSGRPGLAPEMRPKVAHEALECNIPVMQVDAAVGQLPTVTARKGRAVRGNPISQLV